MATDDLSTSINQDQQSTTQLQSCNTGEELAQEYDNIGGGRTQPKDLSTENDIVYTLEGHTLSISRRDLEDLMDTSTENGEELLRRIKSSIEIRLSFNYLEQEWEATPRDGFCGLHVWERLSLRLSRTARFLVQDSDMLEERITCHLKTCNCSSNTTPLP
jgi:hypothetical protein